MFTDLGPSFLWHSHSIRTILRTAFKSFCISHPFPSPVVLLFSCLPAVRISIDSDVVLTSEVGGPDGPGAAAWCRDLNGLGDSEVVRFPHAILEIKINQEEAPAWVQASAIFGRGALLAP